MIWHSVVCYWDITSSNNLQKAPSTSKLDLNLRKELVKCYICSIALCGAESWTVRKVDWKYPESFEMWYENDGKGKLDWSCEKWSIMRSQEGEKYPTNNKKKEG